MGRFIKGSRGGNGQVALTWDLPLTNADSAALGTVTEQTIHYDTVARLGTGVAYANTFPVDSTSAVSKTVTGLQVSQGYYFSISITIGGARSEFTAEAYGVAA